MEKKLFTVVYMMTDGRSSQVSVASATIGDALDIFGKYAEDKLVNKLKDILRVEAVNTNTVVLA